MVDFAYELIRYLSDDLAIVALALFISLVVWEIPRFSKMFEEEWVKGLYPDGGKTVDIILLVIGLLCFLYMQASRSVLLTLPEKPGFNFALGAGLAALPLVILLGFAGRFFSKMDAKLPLAAFIVQTILDFVHSVFFVCFIGLALPAAALLASYFL
jgi:hypothetical protein